MLVKRKLFLISLTLFSFFFFFESIRAENSIDSAAKAYSDGKIELALSIWKKLAKNGDVVALNNLGFLYEKGFGVDKNLVKSLNFYLESAEAGFPTAQYNVGEIYAEGRGVNIDKIKALKWFILSGLKGDIDAREYYEKLFPEMTPDEIREANYLAKNWRPNLNKE